MNLTEFRNQYPQYNGMDDKDLADKIYDTSYKDKMSKDDFYGKIGYEPPKPYFDNPFYNAAVKTLQNVPGSAWNAGESMVHPVLHPQETAENFYGLGRGVLEQLGLDKSDKYKKYPEALGKFFVERYGGWDKLQNTIETDPVGFLLDASTVLTAGGSALAKAPGIASKVGEAVRATGEAINPVSAAGKAVKYGGSKALTGLTNIPGTVGTYIGTDPLKYAFTSGYEGGPAAEAFGSQFYHKAPVNEPVDDMSRALDYMRMRSRNKYLAEIGKTTKDATILNFDNMDRALGNVADIYSYGGKSGAGNVRVITDRQSQQVAAEIRQRIQSFKDRDPREFHTVEGFDELKKSIGEIYRREARDHPNSKSEAVAAELYNAAKRTITDQAPDYAKVMHNYEEASDLMREIQKTFSVNRKASIDTQLRKLQSVLRDNVNTSYGYRKELAQHLLDAGAPYLLEKLSAQALDSWIPRGLGRVVAGGGAMLAGLENLKDPQMGKIAATLALLGMSSPRAMGNVAHGAGTLARGAKNVPYRTLFETNQLGDEPFKGMQLPYEPGPFDPYAGGATPKVPFSSQ